MGDVLEFKKRSLQDRHRGNTLCRRGHHKWVIDKARQFDVKQGRLVTVYRCARCDAQRVTSH